MRRKIVGICICMLVIAIGSASGVMNQSNETSREETVALSMQPFSMQVHQQKIPIVQPIDIRASQDQKPSAVGTDTQVTTDAEAENHPWVEIDNDGNPLVVYDYDTGLGYHEIYLQRSSDGGQTWPADQRYYLAGSENLSAFNPVVELVDNGTRAIVSFQKEPQPDPTFYSVDLYDINDPATWVLVPNELSANISTMCGQTTLDMFGDRNLVLSFISDSIPTACDECWFIIGATDIDNGSTYDGIYWYYTGGDYMYSHPTVAAGTQYFYAASQFTSDHNQIAICYCEKENTYYTNWKSFTINRPGIQLTNPDIAASGQYAYLVIQTDENGNNDILCYTPPSTGVVWQKHVVVESSDDEMYPSVTAIGTTVLCTFVKNGNLYSSKSEDGGITWSTPEQISDEAASISAEYRCANVEGPYIAWMDSRNINTDIYADVTTMPWVAFKRFTGGLGCSIEITNVGTGDATDIEYDMKVQGGVQGLINFTKNGTIDIDAGKTAKVRSGVFFGLGKILMTATIAGGMYEKEGKHLFFFSIMK